MKKDIFCFCVIFGLGFVYCSRAQLFSDQIVITGGSKEPRCVYAADLDNDGDVDVLSASSGDNKIAWYENKGQGVFGEERVITTFADGASSVYAADLDGDGDVDVLSASTGDNKIAWYRNKKIKK